MLKMRNTREDRIRKLISKLIAEMGGDKSESASEYFIEVLGTAVNTVKKEIKASHKKGLCWACTTSLAMLLSEEVL